MGGVHPGNPGHHRGYFGRLHAQQLVLNALHNSYVLEENHYQKLATMLERSNPILENLREMQE